MFQKQKSAKKDLQKKGLLFCFPIKLYYLCRVINKQMKKILYLAVVAAMFACQANEGTGQWVKYEGGPVLGGGDLGTVFDVFVLKDGKEYVMYSSWRPRRSVAVSTSSDGIHWTMPEIVLRPNDATDWEDDINRPAVVKKDGIYHLWYTGQYKGAASPRIIAL